MAQTQQVITCLDFNTETQIMPIVSSGDKIAGPLRDHGGKSLFTKELDLALLNGEIDLAVHSMKDVETPLPKGLVIAAVPIREDPRDVLIYQPGLQLDNLPLQTTIGTSSLRRAYQLNYYLKNIALVPARGNVQTRLQKYSSGEMTSLILAMAGLKRLALFNHGEVRGIHAQTQILDPTKYVPAPGQGALVIIKRSDDHRFDAALAKINHPPSRMAVEVERQVVEALEVTCHDPIGVHAQIVADGIQPMGVLLRVMLFNKNTPTGSAPITMEEHLTLQQAQLGLHLLLPRIKKACEFNKSL